MFFDKVRACKVRRCARMTDRDVIDQLFRLLRELQRARPFTSAPPVIAIMLRRGGCGYKERDAAGGLPREESRAKKLCRQRDGTASEVSALGSSFERVRDE